MTGSRYPMISQKDFDALFQRLKNWNRWGANDERGTLNYITPDKVVAAAALVKSGRSVSMSIPIEKEPGPVNPRPAIHYMARTHDIGAEEAMITNASSYESEGNTAGEGADGAVGPHGRARPGGGIHVGFATDFLGMQFHGDCHTHLDALCHISYNGLLYNGKSASTVDSAGASCLDVTAYAHGIVGRGVMIDVPRYRGVKWLEPGEAVTAEEIEAIEASQGVRLEQGDIMMFRTGQYLRRLELGPWDVGVTGEGRAGLDPYSLLLLHERKVAAFLPEGDGEVAPSYVESLRSPIHALQIASMGMLCADSLQLEELAAVCEEEGRFEFMVCIAPLRLPGGTGCPFNAIAIF